MNLTTRHNFTDEPCDIVVVGGGAAGVSCALAAARAGAQVLLLEQSTALGGTVRQALLHTLGGLFDDRGELLNDGLPLELIARLQRACPQTQSAALGKRGC
ncbi:MAG: FAD-dependent oxidoreductase [Blastocatellia bacterium]